MFGLFLHVLEYHENMIASQAYGVIYYFIHLLDRGKMISRVNKAEDSKKLLQ